MLNLGLTIVGFILVALPLLLIFYALVLVEGLKRATVLMVVSLTLVAAFRLGLYLMGLG